MKKTLSVLAVVVLFTACKSGKSDEKVKVVLVQDTSMLYNNSVLTDKSNEQTKSGSTLGSAITTYQAKSSAEKQRATAVNSDRNTSTSSTNTSVAATEPAKKKGWSHKAKGTVVGAGTGAITGALVNKNNRGVGALVGGLVGAASGYIIGNEVDNKKKKQP